MRYLNPRIIKMLAATSAACMFCFASAAHAEADKIKVGTQFGLAYLPLVLMESDHIWEKNAKALGVDVNVDYARLGGGSALNDALISSSVDVVAGGFAPMLVMWDKTQTSFKVKALAALNASPVDILANRPQVQNLKDFTEDDRIAVPSIRTSIQAIVLMAAAEKEFGPGQAGKLDNQTVAMQHPDATAALGIDKSPIAGYVSSSPFQEMLLKNPKISKVTDSYKVFGGPTTLSVSYAKDSFSKNNPLLTKAFYTSLDEAFAMIKKDPEGAIAKYKAVTGDRTDSALLLETIKSPDCIYGSTPMATLKMAELMNRVGILKSSPTSWKDYFTEQSYAYPGN